ncbi:hypothetical protein KQ302_05020, partial [Synechococcus sp. CS-602]|uniref:hypothetical protein n=1 Tax=Synechococcus sp. CS-602 TaxID=2847982 RepID=UPI00223B2F16
AIMMFPIHSWPLHDVASKDLLGHGQFSAFDWLKPAAGQGFWLFQEALCMPNVKPHLFKRSLLLGSLIREQ